MDSSALSYAKAVAAGPALRTPGETRAKNFSRFYPCNPLISLDSDERIQGNPRKSNAQNLGFRAETLRGKKTPNWPPGAASRPPAEKLHQGCGARVSNANRTRKPRSEPTI